MYEMMFLFLCDFCVFLSLCYCVCVSAGFFVCACVQVVSAAYNCVCLCAYGFVSMNVLVGLFANICVCVCELFVYDCFQILVVTW